MVSADTPTQVTREFSQTELAANGMLSDGMNLQSFRSLLIKFHVCLLNPLPQPNAAIGNAMDAVHYSRESIANHQWIIFDLRIILARSDRVLCVAHPLVSIH